MKSNKTTNYISYELSVQSFFIISYKTEQSIYYKEMKT